MKIKSQITILSGTIIAIPVLCTLFICFLHFIRNPERMLLSGAKEIREIERQTSKFGQEEWQELRETMHLLPPNVQATLIDEERIVLYSTIPEIEMGTYFSNIEMWKLMNETSDKYFYQFTTPNFRNYHTVLFTRVSRDHEVKKNKLQGFISPLLIFLIFIVLICFLIIIFLSKNIFHSIDLVEEKTSALAEGKLETEIITNNKQNEIISTLNNLEIMRKSLVEAQNRKNKFIMGISHDLRTPVAVIKGYIEAIQDGLISEPDEILETMNMMEDKATKLENMINTLISYTKMESSEIKEKLVVSSITKIIENFSKGAVITGGIYKRNIVIDFNLDQDYKVPLDEQLVARLFENLYSNAIRYSKENDTITITSYKEGPNIVVKVADTGIGIAKEDLKNIFDLFYRGTNSRREEGMGIGLSVVKNIVDVHGWKIEVQSEKDKGSCFIITIPVNA